MRGEYCLIFRKDDSDFIDALQKAFIKNLSESQWKDFEKYHFSGLEKELSEIINTSVKNEKIDEENNSVTHNGYIFEVTNLCHMPKVAAFDIVMTIPDFRSDMVSTSITFKGLSTKLRKEKVKFVLRRSQLEFKKEDYSKPEWKVIEKIFGFEEAEEIYSTNDIMVSGYGILSERKCDNE